MELCHDILSHFCEVQNHLQIEESLKISERKGLKGFKFCENIAFFNLHHEKLVSKIRA